MTAEEGVHAAANEMTDCFDGLGLTWEERELITRAGVEKGERVAGEIYMDVCGIRKKHGSCGSNSSGGNRRNGSGRYFEIGENQ